MQEEAITIQTPFIRVDALLKFSGDAETGGRAKLLIAEGQVAVNGAVCTARGKKLYPGDRVTVNGRTLVVQ